MSAAFRPPPLPDVRRSPPRGRVLVVAPHPDDETMGLGGTLALHARQEDPVKAVFICSGIQGDPDGYIPREELEETRKAEAREAAGVLGIGELQFLGYPDNLSDADYTVFENLPENPDDQRRALVCGLAQILCGIMDDGGFDLVYHPWEEELNADHWAVGRAVRQLRETRPDLEERVSFLGYEIWSPAVPETVVDTSDVIATKLAAIRCYRSQLMYHDYTSAVLGLDAYRSLLLERGATYGEAFRGRYRKPLPEAAR